MPEPTSQPQLSIDINDLFAIIGELEVTKRKQGQQLSQLYTQINEMLAEIERLRAKRKRGKKNGGLVKPPTDNAV